MASGLSSHSQFAMPILIINMGGEMLFILHQRLRAQSVDVEKERKVLRDVLMSMFSPIFIEELFKPQCMYSPQSTKQIFEKLAHSSIMRLNTSSMDKLYDLMAMGVKYQLLSCSSPQQYLHLSLNHLQAMRNMVGRGGDPVPEYLQRTEESLLRIYGRATFGSGDWALLKTSLLTFFQGKKIKVSLFLQKKLQNPTDGTLSLSTNGVLPWGSELVGTTRVFENGYLVREYTQALIAHERASSSQVAAVDPWDKGYTGGHNMYSTTSSMFGSESAAFDADTRETVMRKLQAYFAAPLEGAGGDAKPDASPAPAAAAPKTFAGSYGASLTSEAARAEQKMNAALFRSGADSQGHKAAVSLSSLLAGSSGFDAKAAPADDVGFFNLNIEEIDCAAEAKTMDDMLGELDLKDAPKASAWGREKSGGSKAASKVVDDDDDLLALMDSAAK